MVIYVVYLISTERTLTEYKHADITSLLFSFIGVDLTKVFCYTSVNNYWIRDVFTILRNIASMYLVGMF